MWGETLEWEGGPLEWDGEPLEWEGETLEWEGETLEWGKKVGSETTPRIGNYEVLAFGSETTAPRIGNYAHMDRKLCCPGSETLVQWI